MCLHVWTRGLGCFAGGVRLVGCSPRGSVFVCLWARGVWTLVGVACAALCGRAVGVGVPPPLVGVWVASRERACLREAGGRVGDVEGVAFAQELFGLVCGDDAADDGRPLSRVFAACAYCEELPRELVGGYWAGGVFAVWTLVSECGVFGGGSDGGCAAVGFE